MRTTVRSPLILGDTVSAVKLTETHVVRTGAIRLKRSGVIVDTPSNMTTEDFRPIARLAKYALESSVDAAVDLLTKGIDRCAF